MSQKKSAEVRPLGSEALRPSLLLVLAVITSVSVSYGIFFRDTFLPVTAVCGALALPVLFLYLKGLPPARIALRFGICAVLCGAAAFAANTRVRHFLPPEAPVDCGAYTAVVTERTPYRYKDRLFLTLSPIEENAGSVNAVSWIPKQNSLHEGDTIAVSAKPDLLDYQNYADSLRQGITHSIRLTDTNWSYITKTQVSLRTKARNALVSLNNGLYGEHAGFINALMLGDSCFVDKKTTYDFTRAGILHILAASGTHVAIIAAIPMFLFSLVRLPKKYAYLVTSGILVAYFYMTCMPVSLLRACVMFWTLTAIRVAGRTDDTLNALYLSAVIILLLHPYDLFSLGFQLSYGATFGVIVLQKRFRRALPDLPCKISDSISLTLSAQVSVLPVLCLTLGELNLTGLISNIFLVPGTGLAFLGAIGCDLLALIAPSAGSHAAQLIVLLMKGNIFAAHSLARLPGHFLTPDTPLWLLLPYTALCIPLFLRKIRPAFAAPCLAAAVAGSFIPLWVSRPCFPAELAVLSSPQKRALYHEGETALIRGGIRSARERNAVKNIIRAEGYCTTSLYLDDFSSESLRETAAFVRTTPVDEVVIADGIPLDGRSLALLDALETDGVTPVFERPAESKSGCLNPAGIYQMKRSCEAAMASEKKGSLSSHTAIRYL